MFRLLKRRKAIKSFIYRLSLELQFRFDQKNFYSIEEVDRIFENGKYNKAFIAYAYALFCSRASFDSYFNQLKVNCTYDTLRKFVARNFFNGIIDFNAVSIIHFAKAVRNNKYQSGDFYESNIGGSAGTTDPH